MDATSDVRRAIGRQSLDAPEGIVSVDAETLHTWRPFYLGKIRADAQFEVVWSLEKPVRPVPYPVLRSRAAWDAFVERLYTTWGTQRLQSPDADGSSRNCDHAGQAPGLAAFPKPAAPSIQRSRSYQR